ncbi:unnamed protein product [Phytophthora lilii]|uniref:Unnamed protein product n=1 Tax=Phytophthora lilii TaxID=2077276 RepID=A0A9W6WW57_9STRA|nr:unnamed protein product [Phytophthora lilii]
MLRSLDPKFACITIPYWDYFADYARFLERKCENGGTSLEACSSILRGLGGSQGAARTVNINGSATVDLLHQIYLECQLGDDVVPTDKNVSRWVFQQCKYRDEVSPTATSNVTQLWMVNESYSTSKRAIRAEGHPKLNPFFKSLPTKYWEFVNINKLGAMSYEYQRDDLIQNLQRYGFVCPKRGVPIRTALSSANTATINLETKSSETAFESEVTTNLEAKSIFETASEFMTSLLSRGGPQVVGLSSTEVDTYVSEQQGREQVQEQTISLLETTLLDALNIDGSTRTAFNQAELIECEYHLESTGEVEDYTPFFRENYGLGPNEHPRCWNLIHQLRAGLSEIRVDNWRDIIDDHFNKTQVRSEF